MNAEDADTKMVRGEKPEFESCCFVYLRYLRPNINLAGTPCQ